MKTKSFIVQTTQPFRVEQTRIPAGTTIAVIECEGAVDIGSLLGLVRVGDRVKVVRAEHLDDDPDVDHFAENRIDAVAQQATDLQSGSLETSHQADGKENVVDETGNTVEGNQGPGNEDPAGNQTTGGAPDPRDNATLLSDVLEADHAALYAAENVETRGELVEWLSNGNKLTTPNGIGDKTAPKIAAALFLDV